jgi:TonB family protein
MRSPVAFCGTIFATLLMPCLASQANAQTTYPAPVASLILQGDKFSGQRAYDRALQCYQKADKLADHACPECLFREIKMYKAQGDFSSALNCAKKAETEAGSDKTTTAEAFLMHANLLAAMTSKPKDKKLVEAVADTRQALALDPQQTVAHFNLGVLLMKQEQDADGIVELKAYLASSNVDPKTAEDARNDIADPRRAREPFAPDFAFTTLENEQVSLASLRGKVVLLDFWGSWCPPCRASIPTIAGLQKDYGKKGVEFVGISSDDDDAAWRKFIAANRMVWPEYRDADGSVERAFTVDSFPTYIVLDRNGVIRFRQSGFAGVMSEQEIAEALSKALKEKPEAGGPPVSAASASSAPSATASPSASATAPSQTNAPAAASATQATTSAYGNPEPTYIHVPPHDAAPSMGAPPTAPADHRKGLFMVGVLVEPAASDDVHSYASSIASGVKARWLAALPQEARDGKPGVALVQLAIDQSGKLANEPQIMKSTGDDALDHAALAAISAAAPFPAPPPPSESTNSTLQVQLVFAYNETSTDAIRSLASQNR